MLTFQNRFLAYFLQNVFLKQNLEPTMYTFQESLCNISFHLNCLVIRLVVIISRLDIDKTYI